MNEEMITMTNQEYMAVMIRDELYVGSTDEMRKDLKDRLESLNHDKTVGSNRAEEMKRIIKRDLSTLDKVEDMEKRGVDVSGATRQYCV